MPHITVDLTLHLKRGWSIQYCGEYEHFYVGRESSGNFKDDYATNLLFVNKSWSEGANLKAGIIDIPVGITNMGGPALTIYDPVSEASIAPMTWHEGGMMFWGEKGKIAYAAGIYVYGAVPLNESRVLGGAARLD